MTASIRGLAILAAIGAALLLVLVFDRERASPDRTLLPGFVPANVRSLTWTRPATSVKRQGTSWTVDGAPTDARVIDDLLGSLHAARWHRRAAHDLRVKRTLAIETPARAYILQIGEPLEGGAQTWIRVDTNDAVLVDSWLATLLDPDALAFRDRTPLAGAANAATIAVDPPSVDLTGAPWRTRDGLITPGLGDALAAALANLQLVALADPKAPRALATVAIAVAGAPVVRVGGPCAAPDQTAIFVGDLPPACVATAAWTDATVAIAALARPAAETLERRPAPFAIDKIELAGGALHVAHARLDLDGRTVHADPDRVAELVRALATPGDPIATPTGTPSFTLTITPVRGEPIVIDGFADSVHRRGDALALRIAPGDRAILARAATALADTERWAEEASTITTLVLDGVTYRRGAVIGEWTREPAGKIDPKLVDAVAAAVAKLHVPAAAAPTATHHLAVTFAPPVGTPVTHAIEIGARCTGTVDGQGAALPPALCTAVTSLAAR